MKKYLGWIIFVLFAFSSVFAARKTANRSVYDMIAKRFLFTSNGTVGGTSVMDINSGGTVVVYGSMLDANGNKFITGSYVSILNSGTYFNAHSGDYYTANPLGYLVDADIAGLAGGLTYKGAVNASLGVFPTPCNTGDFYKISGAGTIDGMVLATGDMIVGNKYQAGVTSATSRDKIANAVPIESDPFRMAQSGGYVKRTSVSTDTAGGASDTIIMSQNAVSGFVNSRVGPMARIQKRVYTSENTGTISPNKNYYDVYNITWLTGAITITGSLSGNTSNYFDGDDMEIRLAGSGPQNISFSSGFSGISGLNLPTTTLSGYRIVLHFERMSDFGQRYLLKNSQIAFTHVSPTPEPPAPPIINSYSWFEIQPAGAIDGKRYDIKTSNNGEISVAINNAGRLYMSANYGITWNEIMIGGDINRNWYSIGMNGDGKTIIAGVAPGRLYISYNYGSSWAETRPAGSVDINRYSADISDDGSKIILGSHGNGAFYSSDSGLTYRQLDDLYTINDMFSSRSVSISRDGSTSVIGTYMYDIQTGRILLFTGSGSGKFLYPFGMSVTGNIKLVKTNNDGSKIIVGLNGGRLAYSSNTGETWTEIQPDGDKNALRYSVGADSGFNTIIVGQNNTTGKLFMTTGGALGTWAIQEPVGLTSGKRISACINANGGYSFAGINVGKLYMGTGGTWVAPSVIVGYGISEIQPEGSSSASRYGVASDYDGSHIMGVQYGGRIWLSSNYGVTWTETRPAGDANINWFGIESNYDGSSIIVSKSYSSRINKSTDYGATWTELQPDGDRNAYWFVTKINTTGDKILAAEYGGRVWLSSNSGSTRTETRPVGDVSRNWRSAAASKDLNNIIIGMDSGRLYITNNGGSTWTETRPKGDNNGQRYGLASNDDGSILIAGDRYSRLYKSINYGATWNEVRPAGDVNKEWYSAGMDGDGKIIIAGVGTTNGSIYKSLDYGVTWTYLFTTDKQNVWYGVGVSNDGSRIILGNTGLVLGTGLY